jgi:Zn ribbon nucleic-acid-binding protein
MPWQIIQKFFPDSTLHGERRVCRSPDTSRWLAVDAVFELDGKEVLIESDGRQHFACSFGLGTDSVQRYAKRDLYKELAACTQGLTIVRFTHCGKWPFEVRVSYLESALTEALRESRGQIIHPNLPCYMSEGFYASTHAQSRLAQTETIELVPFGRRRVLGDMPSSASISQVPHVTKRWSAEQALQAREDLRLRHPNFRPEWKTKKAWTSNVVDWNTVVFGICDLCGLRVKGTLHSLLVQKHWPGTAVPECAHDCFFLKKAEESTRSLLAGSPHVLISIKLIRAEEPVIMASNEGFAEVNWLVTDSREAFAVTRCSVCQWKCQTLAGCLRRQFPACVCSKNAFWAPDEGYLRCQRLIRSRFPAFRMEDDLQWWRQSRVTAHTEVRLRCKDCGYQRNLRLKRIETALRTQCPDCASQRLR